MGSNSAKENLEQLINDFRSTRVPDPEREAMIIDLLDLFNKYPIKKIELDDGTKIDGLFEEALFYKPFKSGYNKVLKKYKNKPEELKDRLEKLEGITMFRLKRVYGNLAIRTVHNTIEARESVPEEVRAYSEDEAGATDNRDEAWARSNEIFSNLQHIIEEHGGNGHKRARRDSNGI